MTLPRLQPTSLVYLPQLLVLSPSMEYSIHSNHQHGQCYSDETFSPSHNMAYHQSHHVIQYGALRMHFTVLNDLAYFRCGIGQFRKILHNYFTGRDKICRVHLATNFAWFLP